MPTARSLAPECRGLRCVASDRKHLSFLPMLYRVSDATMTRTVSDRYRRNIPSSTLNLSYQCAFLYPVNILSAPIPTPYTNPIKLRSYDFKPSQSTFPPMPKTDLSKAHPAPSNHPMNIPS